MFSITAVFLKRSLVDIALALIVLRSRDAHVAANLSGMAQGVGYTLAATAFGLGAGRNLHVAARSEHV